MKTFLTVFALFPTMIFGCDYTTAPTVEQIKGADAVFIGTVTNMAAVPLARHEQRRTIYTFEIAVVYKSKGELPASVKVYGPLKLPCGDQLEPASRHKYLLFAYFHPANQWLRRGDRGTELPKPNDLIITEVSSASGDIASPEGTRTLNELNELLKDGVKIVNPASKQ